LYCLRRFYGYLRGLPPKAWSYLRVKRGTK
jgi:hypothetical protein